MVSAVDSEQARPGQRAMGTWAKSGPEGWAGQVPCRTGQDGHLGLGRIGRELG